MGKSNASAAASPAPTNAPAEAPDEVLMEKDGVRTEVRNGESVKVMEEAGWKLVKA